MGGDNNFEDFNQGQFGPQGFPVQQLPHHQQQQQQTMMMQQQQQTMMLQQQQQQPLHGAPQHQPVYLNTVALPVPMNASSSVYATRHHLPTSGPMVASLPNPSVFASASQSPRNHTFQPSPLGQSHHQQSPIAISQFAAYPQDVHEGLGPQPGATNAPPSMASTYHPPWTHALQSPPPGDFFTSNLQAQLPPPGAYLQDVNEGLGPPQGTTYNPPFYSNMQFSPQ